MNIIHRKADTLCARASRSPNRHKHVAIIFRGKSIIALCYNMSRRDTVSGKITGRHAEIAALAYWIPGDIIIVLRYNKRGQLMNSMPCPECQQVLGSRKVYYSHTGGELLRLRRAA